MSTIYVDPDHVAGLNQTVNEIFSHARDKFGWDWTRLAQEARLAPLTVTRLGESVTRLPRFYTVQKLARAVGWDMQIARRVGSVQQFRSTAEAAAAEAAAAAKAAAGRRRRVRATA